MIKRGGESPGIFFILEGKVYICTKDYKKKFIKLKQRCFFGESLLLLNKKSKYNFM